MTNEVPWEQLGGDTTEKIVATLLCLEHPNANRIRPDQGDGGVDILVPNEDGTVDVYQVKAYASGIKGSRGSKIKQSLATVAANDLVKIHTWYLTIPLDPTLGNRQAWLTELGTTVAFECQWFGLANLDGLAAKHPEVIEYYLGDGRARVEATIRDLLQLSNMASQDERGEGKLLSPDQVIARLDAISSALNHDDPHFAYELQVTQSPVPLTSREGLVCSIGYETAENYITIHVVARYNHAVEDRPVTINLNVDPAELNESQAAALENALTYGTGAEIPVRNVRIDLPAGLGAEYKTAKLWMGPSVAVHASTDPYVFRLVVNDPDGNVLADAPFTMNPVTQGPRGGLRATGTAVSGGLEVEILINPIPGAEGGTFQVKLHAKDFAGLSPAALKRTTRFLANFVAPNRLNIAGEFGPPLADPLDIPTATPMLAAGAADFMDALADIQNEVDGNFRVPELDALTPDNRKSALLAAALARGQQVRDTWSEETLPVPPFFTHIDGAPLEYSAVLTFHIGDQTARFGAVAVQLNSATCQPGEGPNSATQVIVTPADNNIKILKWMR